MGLLQIPNNRYELIFPEINKSSLISIDRENFYYINRSNYQGYYLKAVVTPSNKNWVFGDLLAHLSEEHAAFTAAAKEQA